MAAKPGSASNRRLLQPFAGKVLSTPPVWLMRQAGRYLPEYRDVRAKAGGFLDLVYNPALAAEVTLQPIRRYGFDAAILFSDILVVPDALGQPLRFAEGEGPLLEPIADVKNLSRLRAAATRPKFQRVAETVQRLRQDLPSETALIGFCGAPWTVATYMVEGKGSKDQAAARLWAYRDRDGFQTLIDLLVEVSVDYLSMQVKAGADVLQIFDTWAGCLPDDEFDRWVVEPTKIMVAALKGRHPGIPIIGFPRIAEFRSMLADLLADREPGDRTGAYFYAAVTSPGPKEPSEIWFRAHDNGVSFGLTHAEWRAVHHVFQRAWELPEIRIAWDALLREYGEV